MQIEILDAIECQLLKVDAKKLEPCLSYDAVYYKQGLYKKTRHQYKKQVFTFKGKKYYRFHTGLLPRVTRWCADHNIPVQIVGEEIKIPRQNKPFLKGIEFREDQLKFIDVATQIGRGLLIAPTQTGKTIVFLGILSCYPKLNILILTHTTTIVKQTYERLQKFGFLNLEVFGGDVKIDIPKKRIVVSTIQSFAKLDPSTYADYFDCVIVDEVHRVSKQISQYKKVLSKLLAPLRFGFTATPKDTNQEAQLTYEGLLGPIIAKLAIQEATELKILIPPKIKLIKADYQAQLIEVSNYQDTYEKLTQYEIEVTFYNGSKETFLFLANRNELQKEVFSNFDSCIKQDQQNGIYPTGVYHKICKKSKNINGKRLKAGAYTQGIVENKLRNKQIAEIVKENVTNNKIIFIFVTQKEHGYLLQKEIEQLLNCKIPLVQGSTSEKVRNKTKKDLVEKKINCCIATIAWMEGITIETINSLILAGGGRSELQLLQKIGRVLGKIENKDQVTVYDFLDLGNKHLILHTGERLATYSNLEWL